jgi:hypothetical protein
MKVMPIGPNDFLCDVDIITHDAGSLEKQSSEDLAISSIYMDEVDITCYKSNHEDVRPWADRYYGSASLMSRRLPEFRV